MSAAPLPMFPLGSVLFPGAVLPLQVFEPRYRVMMDECLAGDARFGVVLIERGSEVGGGDVRTDLGTRAAIVESQRLPDGRWVLLAVGLERIRVVRWLEDSPYPRAEVVPFADPDVDDPVGLAERWRRLQPLLRRVLAQKAEVGDPAAPATVELADDPIVGGWQAAIACGMGPLDQQRLLSLGGPEARMAHLEATLAEEEEFLARRLA